jgi:hypothetical protein
MVRSQSLMLNNSDAALYRPVRSSLFRLYLCVGNEGREDELGPFGHGDGIVCNSDSRE